MRGSTRFGDAFKRDAVTQITQRGYPLREVAERLGASQYAPHSWKKKFANASSGDAENAVNIRWLKKAMARMSKERTFQKGHRVFRQSNR